MYSHANYIVVYMKNSSKPSLRFSLFCLFFVSRSRIRVWLLRKSNTASTGAAGGGVYSYANYIVVYIKNMPI